jgi:hypothetical protein
MEVLKVVLLAILLMALVFAGLAIQMLLKKGGKFPNTHVGSNKYLKSKGVTCAQTDDKMEQAKVRKELRYKKISLDTKGKYTFS